VRPAFWACCWLNWFWRDFVISCESWLKFWLLWPRWPDALKAPALLEELCPTNPVLPPACRFCIPPPGAICELPPVPLLLDPEPPCVELPPMPVVIPEPSPDGLAPDVLPSVVGPNAPVVVLPRFA
jgi:hypothetical protein